MSKIKVTARMPSEGWGVQREINPPGQKSEPRNLGSDAAGDQSTEVCRQSRLKSGE